jgi:hypothetical protein
MALIATADRLEAISATSFKSRIRTPAYRRVPGFGSLPNPG